MSDPSLVPWVGVRYSGTVVCAHCMAGAGEACSHITALLYSTMAKADMVKICHIQFESPMKIPLHPVSCSPVNVTAPNDAELAAFFKDLHEVNQKAAILSIVPGYCDSFNPTSQSSRLSPLMSSYYKPECISHALNDLILESQILFKFNSLLLRMNKHNA